MSDAVPVPVPDAATSLQQLESGGQVGVRGGVPDAPLQLDHLGPPHRAAGRHPLPEVLPRPVGRSLEPLFNGEVEEEVDAAVDDETEVTDTKQPATRINN